MTKDAHFKRSVRSRAAKTGESYTIAHTHLLTTPPENPDRDRNRVRIAVAQTFVYDDPQIAENLRESGREIRRLMRESRKQGAKLIQFTEGATCFPGKRVMSSTGPEKIGPADWTRFDWPVLREELDEIRRLARELGLWTVIGSVHQLTEPSRPHNSLYVISDRGELVTRYDERMISNTKLTFMYTPGAHRSPLRSTESSSAVRSAWNLTFRRYFSNTNA